MDGGVSTHLESIIAPETFSHRALWSSSLLLTEEGKASIVQGHRDWLDSGSNILTTVTYQCHYGLIKVKTCCTFKSDIASDIAAKGAIEQSINDTNDVNTNNITATATTTTYDKEKHERNNVDDPTTSTPTNDKMREMMIDGVFLAKQAIASTTTSRATSRNTSQTSSSSSLGPFVVASTGPYGAAMADGSEYTGKYPPHVTRQALLDFHTCKARTLLMDGKPDGLAVETIPNIQELGVVCEVLRDLQQQRQQQELQQPGAASPIACWVSLACRNGKEMNDGHTVEEALRIIQSYDPTGRWIAAVGINCCDSAYIASLVTTLTKGILLGDHYHRGIVIYPNSGEGWDAVNEEWKDATGTTDIEFADRLMEAVQIVQDTWKMECAAATNNKAEAAAAATTTKAGKPNNSNYCLPKIILGGCCRTNPATIATLRKRIDARDIGNI